MWAFDPDDGAHWIGGVIIDAPEQGHGIGRAAMETMIGWLAVRPDCQAIRLDYAADNASARRLYESLGFNPVDQDEDGTVIAEFDPATLTA